MCCDERQHNYFYEMKAEHSFHLGPAAKHKIRVHLNMILVAKMGSAEAKQMQSIQECLTFCRFFPETTYAFKHNILNLISKPTDLCKVIKY